MVLWTEAEEEQGRKTKSFAAAEVHALGNVEEYAVEEISESVEDQQGIVANDENMNEDEVTALRTKVLVLQRQLDAANKE